MDKLNLPDYAFTTRKNDKGKVEIFDDIRQKFILLTPEEHVRQRFIKYLILFKEFPASLMAVEKGLKVNYMPKRTDIVQYGKNGKPLVIIECKAPHIVINQDTVSQAAMYNMKMKVQYLILTNGMTHYCCKINYRDQKLDYMEEIPMFHQL